jgi:hypothetical protein
MIINTATFMNFTHHSVMKRKHVSELALLPSSGKNNYFIESDSMRIHPGTECNTQPFYLELRKV